MRTPTLLPALLLAAAIPAGAQTLDYETLCGATEGAGDNNDFCTLWAQRNYQGMRNALSISIRTARAAENRNRYYFDHKRGAERGAFIQLKRNWMGDDWRVLQHAHGYGGVAWIFSSEVGALLTIDLSKEPFDNFVWDVAGVGFESIVMYGGISNRDEFEFERQETQQGPLPADFVRRMVECKIDEFGYNMGVADERRDCENITEGNDYDGGRPTTRTKLPTPVRRAIDDIGFRYGGSFGGEEVVCHQGVGVVVRDPRNGADWYQLEVTQVDPDQSEWEQVTDRDFGERCARGEPCDRQYFDEDVTTRTIPNGHWRLRIRYLASDWETSEWSGPVYYDYSDSDYCD